jgi:diphthine synthase
MLYLIGIGLGAKDISLKALEAIKKSDLVYLETYTSASDFTIEELSNLIGKEIIPLTREQTETKQPYLTKEKTISLLIYGDPLSATTHLEIIAQANKQNITTEIIHSSSIFTAVAETGLFLYKFGKTASIPFPQQSHKPTSFYDILNQNQSVKAHTLFLLDLKPPEQFMTPSQAISILLELGLDPETKAIGCQSISTKNQKIIYTEAKNFSKQTWKSPPYCLIIPAELNFKEEEFLQKFKY